MRAGSRLLLPRAAAPAASRFTRGAANRAADIAAAKAAGPPAPHPDKLTLNLAPALRPPLVLTKASTLQTAATRMAEAAATAVLVVENGGGSIEGSGSPGAVPGAGAVVAGLLTRTDILAAVQAKGVSALGKPVGSFMTPAARLLHAPPSATFLSLTLLMARNGVSHVPIVEPDTGRCVDVVSADDLAAASTAAVGSVAGAASGVGLPAPTLLGGVAAASAVSVTPAVPAGPPVLRFGSAFHARAGRPADAIEDAHFLASPRPGLAAFGLADGVGSWHQHGVDPRAFSRALMEAAAAAAAAELGAAVSDAPPGMTAAAPVRVLAAAWEAVKARGVVGSSTAVIGCVDTTSRCASLVAVGDSVALLLRRRRTAPPASASAPSPLSPWMIAGRTVPQARGFNQPYQLGYAPDTGKRFETPADAEASTFTLAVGDVLLVASDGLFDNLEEEDILAQVAGWEAELAAGGAGRSGGVDGASTLATRLADAAFKRSTDRSTDGPFARAAKDNDILWKYGGRPDDITVLVLHVAAASAPAAAPQ